MRSLTVWTLAAFALLSCRESNAQVFRLTGGASSGFQAQGAGIEVRGKDYEAWSGAGVSSGHVIFGSFVQIRLHQYTVKVGDNDIAITLPTDIFGAPSRLQTRGVSIDKQMKRTTLHLFAGEMGTSFTSPMFRAGIYSGPPAVMLFSDTMLTPKLHMFSHNIFSSAQTTISGIEWKARSDSTLSFAAGVGTGRPYSSEAVSLSREHFDLKLAYVAAADGFQRSLAGTPLQSEPDGANISGSIRPTPSTGLGFGHQNYVVPASGQQATLHAQVDNLSGGWKIREFEGPTVGAAVFRSSVLNRTARGASLWASQTVGPLDLRLNYLVSSTGATPPLQSILLTSQERLSPRLSILQVSSYSAGQTSVAFGGSLLTNRFSIGISYQTLYVPFRPDHPFNQAVSINLNLNVHGNLRLSTATSFTPQGKMIYTLAGSDSYYRLSGLEAAPQPQVYRLHGYVIKGRVTVPDGLPVYGAAIRIGKELVYSDRNGRFFARERKSGSYKVEVVLKEFIATGNFAVTSAPDQAVTTKDQDAAEIAIVLTRS